MNRGGRKAESSLFLWRDAGILDYYEWGMGWTSIYTGGFFSVGFSTIDTDPLNSPILLNEANELLVVYFEWSSKTMHSVKLLK